MKEFKRIMVGLDGEKSDLHMLRHISSIKDSFELQKIYFVHIHQSLELPKNDELLYVEHLAPVDESIETLIKFDIEHSLDDLDHLDLEIIVRYGHTTREIIKLVKEKNIDLLVLGRKSHPGITYFSRNLADEASCSVMFIPKHSHREYQKILVPCDLSVNSKVALDKASMYQLSHENCEIIPVHFYDIPQGYSKSGKSLEEFTAKLKSNLKMGLRKIMSEREYKNLQIIRDKKDNIAQKIFNYSIRTGADLILIGSRGRTKLASYLNKSVATRLIELSYHLPVLVDKQSRKNLSSMSALMRT